MDCLIIHYNTPILTSATIRSLWKHTPQAKVTVFDNSDKEPFPIDEFPQVRYIDNTEGQIVNWDEWLLQFPNKQPCKENNYGSAKHCFSVEHCFDLFDDGFILMDSDILIKKDITPLCDVEKAFVGTIHCNTRNFGFHIDRLCPWLCWINTRIAKQHNIRYFNANNMWKLHVWQPNVTLNGCYDTGAWFLEQVINAKLPYTNIAIIDYIEHFRAASWRNFDYHKEWLNFHKRLWE